MELNLIVRPENLLFYKVDLWFNFDHFSMIEMDISHINFGKKVRRISNYSSEEIAAIVLNFINDQDFMPEATRQFENEVCDYFLFVGKYNGKNYKLIFCLCSDRPN
jgi:hypothetical protein